MKNLINTFVELSCRLNEFGQDEHSKSVILQAERENPWFSRHEIIRSVEAIGDHMLKREALEEWIANYPTLPSTEPKSVAVVMAGNIPLVGFFDLLCVVMAGHKCYVKPSSKDIVLMGYIIDTLKTIDKNIPIYIYEESIAFDAVIATGGDNANKYFKKMFANSITLLRGSRHSVAVLSGEETTDQLEALCDDIYAYSGLGCRNISMIFTPRGHKVELPAYNTSEKYRNNYLQNRAILTLSGRDFTDNGSSCLINDSKFPHALSSISICEYETISEVDEWIKLHDNEIQCIVSDVIKHERCVGFGKAQQPELMDYPDGCDVMKFLEF